MRFSLIIIPLVMGTFALVNARKLGKNPEIRRDHVQMLYAMGALLLLLPLALELGIWGLAVILVIAGIIYLWLAQQAAHLPGSNPRGDVLMACILFVAGGLCGWTALTGGPVPPWVILLLLLVGAVGRPLLKRLGGPPAQGGV